MSLEKNIRLLTWFNFFTDFKLYNAIAILYFAKVAHSYALGASIFSIAYIISALFDIPTGIFADKIGRKKTVILGAGASVLAVTLYATGINYWFLAAGAVFEGLSRAFYSGNNNALLHNLLSDEGMEHDYHVYLGKLSSMFQVALGASALLGALIANWNFSLIIWLSVIPQVICLLISLQITEREIVRENVGNAWSLFKKGVQSFIHNPKLRLLGLSGTIDYGLGETSYQFQAAFYNTLLPIWAVGLAKTCSNIGAAIGFYFSGKIINKLGEFKALILGEIYSKIVSFFSLLVPTPASPFLISTNSIFFGTGTTAEGSLMQKEFTDEQRATMSSISSFAGSLFFGIYAYITGFFADKLGPRNAMLIIQVLSLSVLWLLFKLIRLKHE